MDQIPASPNRYETVAAGSEINVSILRRSDLILHVRYLIYGPDSINEGGMPCSNLAHWSGSNGHSAFFFPRRHPRRCRQAPTPEEPSEIHDRRYGAPNQQRTGATRYPDDDEASSRSLFSPKVATKQHHNVQRAPRWIISPTSNWCSSRAPSCLQMSRPGCPHNLAHTPPDLPRPLEHQRRRETTAASSSFISYAPHAIGVLDLDNFVGWLGKRARRGLVFIHPRPDPNSLG